MSALYENLHNQVHALKETLDAIQTDAALRLSEASEAVAPATEAATGSNLGLTLFVFALAIFLGVELITKVPSQLHTPLMSGSNAISGITIVGALLAMQNVTGPAAILLGLLATITATVNVVGGYLVTDRMLGMFQNKKGGN